MNTETWLAKLGIPVRAEHCKICSICVLITTAVQEMLPFWVKYKQSAKAYFHTHSFRSYQQSAVAEVINKYT